MEEARVIAIVRAGNTDAFGEIIERYQTPVIRYLYRLTGDYETAQDLAQDTFLQAYKAIVKTDCDLHLKAWLYRIATNNAWQHSRRKKLLSFISLEEWRKPTAPVRQPGHPVEELAIEDALGKVPADQRTCLVLHYVEGFKYGEIAETLGITEDAVKKRVARGKQLFRSAYSGGEGR